MVFLYAGWGIVSTQAIARPEHHGKSRRVDKSFPGKELPRAAPIKRAPWEWYLPVYFWAGGVAAGGWLAATAETWAGGGEREVVRIGRYLAFAGVMSGTSLLILDLGRPERFLNMMRVVHLRSAMSLGSWGLVSFGVPAGGAAALQLLEDLSSPRARAARLSRGMPGRVLQLVGLPPALFVGTYTGALLASTSTPVWAERRFILPLLFLASGAANGLAATMGIVEFRNRAPVTARRRLALASSVALATDLTLSLVSERAVAGFPSQRAVSPGKRIVQTLSLVAGTALPLVLTAAHARKLASPAPKSGRDARKRPQRSLLPVVASALTLAGGLALRFRITHEGYRSALTAEDTWMHARDGRRQPEQKPPPEATSEPTQRTIRTESAKRRPRPTRPVLETHPEPRL